MNTSQAMKVCEGCGVDFEPNYPEQRFHTQACFITRNNPRRRGRRGDPSPRGGRSTLAAKVCEGCGVDFKPNYRGQRFHTQACFLRWNNRDSALQSAKGKKGGQVRGQQLKAASSGKGYLKVPGKDVHEHRAVAERVLGRALLPGEVVHHEDENKQNNHPSNLIVFPSQADHARHHKLSHCGLPTCGCPGTRLGVMPDATP